MLVVPISCNARLFAFFLGFLTCCQMEERQPQGKRIVATQSEDMRDNGAQENMGEAMKQRATLSQDRQLPAKVTFTGTGSVGGQALVHVCDGDIAEELATLLAHDGAQEVKLWRKAQLARGAAKDNVVREASFALNCLAELLTAVKRAKLEEKARVFAVYIGKLSFDIVPSAAVYLAAGRPEVIQIFLDLGANGKLRDGVGLRRAIAEELKRLACEWKWIKFKLQEVMNCALANVIPVLEKGGDDAKELLRALGSTGGVFPNTSEQRNLEHLLSQLG